MKSNIRWIVTLSLLAPALAFGQDGRQTRPPAVETTAPNIPGVVVGGTKVQVVKEGFRGTEGPVRAPDGMFLFAEMAGDQLTKIDGDGNTSLFMEGINASGGLTFDGQGRLIAVQRGAKGGKPQLALLAPTKTTLTDNYQGKPFGMPNDLVADAKGTVYFTDSGTATSLTVPRDGGALYVFKTDGTLVKLDDQFKFANGIVLSPDDKVLYVGDTLSEFVLAYDVQPDGTARNRRDFAKLEAAHQPEGVNAPNFRPYGADGIAIDGAGRLYVGSTLGAQVFNPQGQPLGIIPTSRPVQSLAFAGTDRKTLYMVGGGIVWKLPMLAQGVTTRAK